MKIIRIAVVAGTALYGASAYSASAPATCVGTTCTLVGDTINYVYENDQLAIGLFGTPTISGDTVEFGPDNFRAESTNGQGVVTTFANFIFDSVYSTNNKEVSSIQVIEFGDYNISGPDGTLTVDDNVTATLLLTSKSNTSSGEFTSDLVLFDKDGSDGDVTDTWILEGVVDPELAFSNPASDVWVSIQNTLTATTLDTGELAWIQKKLAFTTVAEGAELPPEIPIPAAAWLFGSALLGLMGLSKKKRA